MLNDESLCATDAYRFVSVIIWLLISWKVVQKSLLVIFHYTVQKHFYVKLPYCCRSQMVLFHLSEFSPKLSSVKTQSCKIQSSLHILKVYLLFHVLICLISSHLFWLFWIDSLLSSFWYWVYKVLLLPVSLLLTVILRFEFQLFLQLQQLDSMRFCWDYFHHLPHCQFHHFFDLEEVVVQCQLVHLFRFGNLKYLKLLKVVWTIFCYLFQNPAFQLKLKIMILQIFSFSVCIFQTWDFQQMNQLHLPYLIEYFFHWSIPLKQKQLFNFFPYVIQRKYLLTWDNIIYLNIWKKFSQRQNQMCFDTICAVWAPKKIPPNNISSTFLRSSFSTFSTF